MVERLHLVDGTFELFRAHYSQRPDHQTPDGIPAKATLGVANSMLALLQDRKEAVTHIAVAFDNPIESFRNEMFDGYKTGEGMDPVLRNQFDMVEEAVRALGIVVWSMDRWEADDGLGTGAARFKSSVGQVRVLTPDKDLGQVLESNRVVQVDRIRKKEITEATVRERRGVPPASIPDFLALTGDTADGIPGLPGFGEKTAGTLLGRFGHLEKIPKRAEEWDGVRGAKRLVETFVEGYEDALLYRDLATLELEVPLKEELADLEFQGVPRDRFEHWAEQIGANTMHKRVKRWR